MIYRFVLLFGIFVTSWSSIIIRWIGDVHPLTITFYRLFFSALILLPFARFSKRKRQFVFASRALFLFALSGIFLSLHFFSWIQSLQLTTVGHSIFLESTHPIFALILSYFVLKERSTWLTSGGIVLALLGMYVIVFGDSADFSGNISGDFLAILSAFFLAAYLLIARMNKKAIDLITYLVIVYSAAAFFTLILIIILNVPFLVFPLRVWQLLILLAIGPNLIGHSLLNWASRRMPVYLVNLAMQGEAVLATLFAALLLNETPSQRFYFGAFLIILAVSIIFWGKEAAEND